MNKKKKFIKPWIEILDVNFMGLLKWIKNMMLWCSLIEEKLKLAVAIKNYGSNFSNRNFMFCEIKLVIKPLLLSIIIRYFCCYVSSLLLPANR